MGYHQRGMSPCSPHPTYLYDGLIFLYNFISQYLGAHLQIILRNENFTPPALGGHDRSSYLKLTSIRNLLGRAGQLFLLFGMLSRDPAGRLCLEDGEGRVVLDMDDAVSSPHNKIIGRAGSKERGSHFLSPVEGSL